MTDQLAVVDTARIKHVSALTGELVHRDISGLSHEDLVEEYHTVARLGRLADALEARYAGEIARRSTPDLPGGGLARQQGFGNAAAMVAAVTGGSTAGAWRSIEVGQALMPEPVLLSDMPDQAEHCDQAQALLAPRFPAIAEASLAG